MARSPELAKQIIELYEKGYTYKEIRKCLPVCAEYIGSLVKGKRTLKESAQISIAKGNKHLSEEGRRKLSETGKKSCQKGGKIWTKPEQGFKKILNEMGIGVKFPEHMKEIFNIIDDKDAEIFCQYPVEMYICDFVDLENKIIYNVQGDFWHGNPLLYDIDNLLKIQKLNVVRDKNKRNYLEKKEWVLLDIWESEIYWNKQLVIDKIKTVCSYDQKQNLKSNLSIIQLNNWSQKVKELWFKKPSGRPKIEKIIKYCPICNKKFETKKSEKEQICCSIVCAGIKSRKVIHPSKEQLEQEIKEMTWISLGKKYAVSDNTVRKWAKNYGLPFKVLDIEKTRFKVKCLFCNKNFVAREDHNTRKYCSVECSELGQRKIVRPEKEILLKQIAELGLCKAGKLYNVSGSTVRAWIKQYNKIKS